MSKLAKANQFNRSGNVHYRVDKKENGEAAISISVDFEKAPVPDRSYIADYFEMYRADADVVMVFGKIDHPSLDELRNKIEIYFPFQTFVNQLWKSSRKMHSSLKENLSKKGKAAKLPGTSTNRVEKVQTLAANNALIVMSAGQCVLDFFLLAAKDVWLKTAKGDPLNVDAIVRVFVSEQLLLGFLDECDKLAQDLGAEYLVGDPEDEDEILESI